MINRLKQLSVKQKMLVGVIGILLLVLPLVIIISQSRQDIRQRASGEASTMNITPTTLSKGVGENFDVLISIDTTTYNVSSVDMVVKFDQQILEIVSFQPSSVFGNPLVPISPFNPTAANQSGVLRYIVASQGTTPITGNAMPIVTLTFKGKTAGSGVIGFTKSDVTATGVSDFISTDITKTATITINPANSLTPTVSVTSTPTATPTHTPTPTPTATPNPTLTTAPSATPTFTPTTTPPSSTHTPTLTQAPACERKQGGYNTNCLYNPLINDSDYPDWKSVIGKPGLPNYLSGDYDGSGTVDIRDFNLWRNRKFGL